MQAIREIVSPQSEELVIKLPRNFIQKKSRLLFCPFIKKKKR